MSQHLNLETRINALNAALHSKKEREAVEKELVAVKGDWAAALTSLKGTLPEESLSKLVLAHSLADWSGDNAPLVKALSARPEVGSLRDVALHFSAAKLAEVVDLKAVPADTPGVTDKEKRRNYAALLSGRLFAAEPSAVLHRMVRDAEVPVASSAVRSGIMTFLANQPDFNIRTTSIYKALRNSGAMKGIPEDYHPAVVKGLKMFKRVVALSPTQEAMGVLVKHNLTSAFQVGEMPESTFFAAYRKELGDETAKEVYTAAINTRVRNENTLMRMREVVRGTGIAVIDEQYSLEHRMRAVREALGDEVPPLNLESLFGSIDYCECEDCTSVYSPAAYFVDILQYLRNNNLDPQNPNTVLKGIAGTPLEKLFRRRPDLGCLELTCANTNTVLPYIDLVNEVMESFVVHLGDYHADKSDPKQAKLEVFNVEDETTSELLAQPQHVNYEAYCILKNAVYPFTLPYHQPIDAIRIFLDHLGTSRHELLDVYRTAHECPKGSIPAARMEELDGIHKTVIERATDAELLGLTQEEYIILTREAFWPKRYFDLTLNKTHTDNEYRQKIGVKPVPEYYGYVGSRIGKRKLRFDQGRRKHLRCDGVRQVF